MFNSLGTQEPPEAGYNEQKDPSMPLMPLMRTTAWVLDVTSVRRFLGAECTHPDRRGQTHEWHERNTEHLKAVVAGLNALGPNLRTRRNRSSNPR